MTAAEQQTGQQRGPQPGPRIDIAELSGAVFDTDGVLTDTASLHSAAWKRMFDEYLRERAERTGEPFVPFDQASDYIDHIDGKARAAGASSFLASRGITLTPEDLRALTDRKDGYFLDALHEQGARPYTGSLDFVRRLRAGGLPTAVVSASKHCAEVVRSAGAESLFDVRVDGVDAADLGLPSKPDPAIFLEAARRLGSPPETTLVVEDALAGVEAGRRGGFGRVVGVDRGAGDALAEHGADLVVADLSEIALTAEERR